MRSAIQQLVSNILQSISKPRIVTISFSILHNTVDKQNALYVHAENSNFLNDISIFVLNLCMKYESNYHINFINHYFIQSNLRLYDNDAKFFNEDLVKNRLSLCRSSAKNYIYIWFIYFKLYTTILYTI